MKVKKATIWAVVISVALITAGLILSCGDDGGNGNGEPEATWEDFCEKLVECGLMDEGDLEICEAWCEELEDYYDVDPSDILNCTVDASCAHMGLDCWCKEFCEKLIECEIEYDEDELLFCLADCSEYFLVCFTCVVGDTVCVLDNSCGDIEEECLE